MKLIRFLLMPVIALSCETAHANNEFTRCFDNFQHFRAPQKIDTDTLQVVCDFLTLYGYSYNHHSDYRERPRNALTAASMRTYQARMNFQKLSQHWVGKALDFSLDDCAGYNERVKGTLFLMQLGDIESYLYLIGRDQEMGVGCYPQWRRALNGKDICGGFHVDTRIKKGRWCQIDGKFVGYDYGKNWVRNRIQ